jgi:hypothetical protein
VARGVGTMITKTFGTKNGVQVFAIMRWLGLGLWPRTLS